MDSLSVEFVETSFMLGFNLARPLVILGVLALFGAVTIHFLLRS